MTKTLLTLDQTCVGASAYATEEGAAPEPWLPLQLLESLYTSPLGVCCIICFMLIYFLPLPPSSVFSISSRTSSDIYHIQCSTLNEDPMKEKNARNIVLASDKSGRGHPLRSHWQDVKTSTKANTKLH